MTLSKGALLSIFNCCPSGRQFVTAMRVAEELCARDYNEIRRATEEEEDISRAKAYQATPIEHHHSPGDTETTREGDRERERRCLQEHSIAVK